MHCGREKRNRRSGAAIMVFVLGIAVVGILFGLGRLLSHRYAVERRFERTYQIEKMIATRNALALANTAFTSPLYAPLFGITQQVESVNFSAKDALTVEILPIKDKDRQDMADMDGWTLYSSDSSVTIKPATEKVNEKTVDVFEFSSPVSNIAYRAAAIKELPSFWLESEFGYQYRLDMQSGAPPNNLGSLNMYLVGVWDYDKQQSVNWKNVPGWYEKLLSERPWIKMELQAGDGSSTTVQRNLVLHEPGNKALDGCPFRYNDFISPWRKKNFRKFGGAGNDSSQSDSDSIDHGGGFLITASAFCGFGENGEMGILFSPRWDFGIPTRQSVSNKGWNGSLDNPAAFTNAFEQSLIVIEHVFPTNALQVVSDADKEISRRIVTVDSFTMREPATYSVGVYNSQLKDAEMDKIVTWIFQTEFAVPGNQMAGKQCILDVFGREPANLFNERKGEIPGSVGKSGGGR